MQESIGTDKFLGTLTRLHQVEDVNLLKERRKEDHIPTETQAGILNSNRRHIF